MAYEKTIWATGDVVTAEKLNHMEEGIEAGGGGNYFDVELSVALTESGGSAFTCNRTYAELEAAIENGSVFRVWFNNVQSEGSRPSIGAQFAYSVVQDGEKITFAALAISPWVSNGAVAYAKMGLVVEVTEDSVTGYVYPVRDVTE